MPSWIFSVSASCKAKGLYLRRQFQIQSNSIIVDSIIVENSKIVDDLAATKDFYLIKIHNSRNSKIVELFFGEVARNLVSYQLFLP